MALPATHAPVDDLDPTERFSVQTCPTCGGSTVVVLALPEMDCEICGAPVEVAPLMGPNTRLGRQP